MATQSSPQVPVKSKSSNAWIWTLVRGLFALGLGLYLIIAAQSAPIVVAYALAVYMLVAGAIQTFMSLLNRRAPGSTTDRIRGLVGLAGAGVLLLLVYFNVLSLGAAFTVLAILLVIYGGLGMFEMLFDRGDQRFRLMPFLVNLLLLALGVMVFVSRAQDFDLRLWVGVILAVMGLVLIGYGYFVQKQKA